ncbi:MAG TPA: substrate-binding domain-containing protein [Candidatus Competibacteraceae bacterium]|nr:substrate-binding domain-containing protein [Candidatus Competibacteraceae bacterium]
MKKIVNYLRHGALGLLSVLAVAGLLLNPAQAEERFITVASTTSTQNSGLFDYLLPIFQKQTGIEVRVVAVGTGQAIQLAERGDADILLVHHQPSEEKFVKDGQGVKRFDVMYNDFIIVGPKADPAGIRGQHDPVAAMQKIAAAKAPFASRGDDSGTHKLELELWKAANVDPKAASGQWYRETGSGMGATLNTASGLDAYTLTDRGTWISFKNKGNLEVLVQDNPRLFNQYGVILVNPETHPNVKVKDGQAFIDWLLSPAGQKAIASFKVNNQQLFFPNAKKSGS